MQEEKLVDLTTGAGYRDQWELMRDLFTGLDLTLYFYYAHHQWLGPAGELKNMLGLVVTREEFEHQLAKAALCGLSGQLTPDERLQLADARKAIALRLARTDRAAIPLLRLFARCGLDAFEQCCVTVAYAAVLDRKYERLFAYLQDDMTRKAPGTDLVVQLFLPEDGNVEQYLTRFSGHGRFLSLFAPDALAQGMLVLRPAVLSYLAEGRVPDTAGRVCFDGQTDRPDVPLRVQEDIARQLDGLMEDATPCVVCVSGGAGSGKRFQLQHMLARRRARAVFWDFSEPDWRAQAEEAALIAVLQDAYLCVCRLDGRDEAGQSIPPAQDVIETLCALDTGKERLFLLSEQPIRARLRQLTVSLTLPDLTERDRLTLFRAGLQGCTLAPGVTPEELAGKFRFSPRQIALACAQAAGAARIAGAAQLDGAAIHHACYQQIVHKLDALARRVPAAYTWADVVMPAAHKRLMQQACGHIRYQYQVYTAWGFDRKIRYGRGLSILFAGAPGTGKTMCAQVIAGELNMELYKINISQIVSKYIGETEKNLQAVFTEGKRSNCILFFDECDAIFGKRSEVKDAHDRNANVEVAYLLQQVEEYDGVCILATNLIGNIDAAFMRRLSYVVHFPFPDAAMREQIYRQMLPPGAPVSEEVDWRFLAEKFELSGGHIKNIVLVAAFLAAGEGTAISMRHLLRAAVGELKKNEIVVVRESLREYADLMDDGEEEPT